MANIELLDEHLINQIKAGEVVESPHSMIKEIIENSIDANSTSIKVHIKNNGLDLVEIKDNGDGISFDQLPLAFSRHATSKIKSFGDIYNVYSYGFRGEALASISSVSRVLCISKSKDSTIAGKIEIHGGETILQEPIKQSMDGTVISITNLFYNTPARLKFLKSSRSLRNNINQVIYGFVLTQPNISFHIQFEDEPPIIFEKVTNEKSDSISMRVKQVITHLRSQNIKRKLIQNKFHHESHNFNIYISPESNRGGLRHQYIFVNNRLVEDKKIKAIIQRKMTKQFWPIGNSGDYFLFLNIPSELIDPNVHPSKIIVKFIFPEIVESGIAHLIDKLPVTKAPTSKIDLEAPPQRIDILEEHSKSSFKAKSTSGPTSRNFETQRNIEKTSNRFFIANFSEREINIIHKGLLFKNFLINSMRRYDGETLPLIVALKLNISVDQNFAKSLQRFGFEIETDQNQDFFLLKEIPMYLCQLEDLSIIVDLLEDFYHHKKTHENYQNYLLHMPVNKFTPKDKVVENIIEDNTDNLDHNFFTRTLNQESVDKLFNDSI